MTELEAAHTKNNGRLRVGCPVWAVNDWVGELYESRDRHAWLAEYSSVFETVEGNSTFYALPDARTTERWASQTATGFRFCWKVPRNISHDANLVRVEDETKQLIERLEILHAADRLGPTLLQLGPNFDHRFAQVLDQWLEHWPSHLPLAVEVRHRDWFDEGVWETRLNEMLHGHSVHRCLFDSRPLFSAPPETEAEMASQQRKPRSPFRTTVHHGVAFVRLVGRDRLETVRPWVDAWCAQIHQWLEQDLEVYFFTHSPNDAFAPQFARRLQQTLQQLRPTFQFCDLWPGEQAPKQLELF